MKLFGLEITRADARSVLASPAGGRAGWWPLIREPFAGAWQRNREIRAETVLAHHAVYACITRIAQDIGKLRPKLVQQSEDGIWAETESSAFSPVLRRPNRFQNYLQFQEWWTTSKLCHGNTYVLKERDARGVVRALYVLEPSRVKVLVAPDGAVFYELSQDNLSGLERDQVAVPASEIIHDRINCLWHPLVGTSPIFACGMAAHMGLSIERNSDAFFANGSNPSGVIAMAVDITPQKSAELSTIWEQRFGKEGSGGVAVLGGGAKFQGMRMSAVDSQLIEQLKWSAENVCSAFHVPPFKIGVGQAPTYQNGEVLNQIYYSDCLQALIEQFELAMDEGLGLTTPKEGGRRIGVELDLDGLLRMDTATQVKTLTEGVRGGLYTPNEARRRVDLPRLEGGNTIYLQHQDYPMEKVFRRTDLDPAPAPEPAPPPAADGEGAGADASRAALAAWVDSVTFELETAA